MKLLILLRDLFKSPLSPYMARRALYEQAQLEWEKEERHRMINRMIWEYKNSPAAVNAESLSDEHYKEGAD
jgi:hypothetical protein